MRAEQYWDFQPEPIMYSDVIGGKTTQVGRDDLWAVTTKQLDDVHAKVAAKDAELERLRALVAQYEDDGYIPLGEANRLQAEIARRDETLKKIATDGGPDFDADDMAQAASAALTPAPNWLNEKLAEVWEEAADICDEAAGGQLFPKAEAAFTLAAKIFVEKAKSLRESSKTTEAGGKP